MVELLELHEIPSGELSRRWRVKARTPNGTEATQVFLSHRELNSTPRGTRPLERAFSEADIREAMRLAIQRRLDSAESLATEVDVTCSDLYRAAGEVC